MTSKERMLAAWRCEDVDHVPFGVHFWPAPRHEHAVWSNEPERLAYFRDREWDTRLEVGTWVTPLPEVQVEVQVERAGTQPVLRQRWQTPAGTIEELLRVTDDWPGRCDASHPVGFGDDFRTSRYLEFPFKTTDDLAALPYLFPANNPRDRQRMVRQHQTARALADEFQIPLLAYHGTGLDWLIWLYPPEEAVLRTQDDPACIHHLLEQINAAHYAQLELLLELGVDGVIRRGWYESTDFWSPGLFATFARPWLEREVALAHAAGAAYLYLMDTGITPLLGELSAIPFDCLYGADPATSGQDLGRIRHALPGKSLWGGISGPLHLGMGTPADVEQAVETAFATCGNRGFILGLAVGIRANWPWENIQAFDRAWRKLRR
ncbi:MAG: uroporphyrinogen decarboxylase family protein [Armatimonadota bacterium]